MICCESQHLCLQDPRDTPRGRYVSGKVFFCSFTTSRHWPIDDASTIPKMKNCSYRQKFYRILRPRSLLSASLPKSCTWHEYFTLRRRGEPNVSYLPKLCVKLTHQVSLSIFERRIYIRPRVWRHGGRLPMRDRKASFSGLGKNPGHSSFVER